MGEDNTEAVKGGNIPVSTEFDLGASKSASVLKAARNVKIYALLHQHPPQRITNGMGFVVYLVCRGRKIGLRALKLLLPRDAVSTIRRWIRATYNAQFWCNLGHSRASWRSLVASELAKHKFSWTNMAK